MQALIEQVELANARAERAERESEYFATMMQAIASKPKWVTRRWQRSAPRSERSWRKTKPIKVSGRAPETFLCD
jgi:hypothetical protein